MANFKEIKSRISSVKNTRKITSAMKMVSAAKFNRAQTAIKEARPYAATLMDLIRSLSTEGENHPMLVNRKEKTIQLLVLTSDRGLCGGFNTTLLKTAEKFKAQKESEGKTVIVSCIGRRAVEYFKKRNVDVVRKYPDALVAPNFDDAKVIADGEDRDFIDRKTDAFYMVFNTFVNVLVQEPTVEKLLPISNDEAVAAQDKTKQKSLHNASYDFLYEPGKAAILDNVLPRYFESQVFRAILESVAGEHGARMTAMDNATNNASDLIDSLTLDYNKMRQAAITSEILDIVGGANAL